MKKRKSQTEHDMFVKKIKKEIINKGFTDVRADLPGEKKPLLINNYLPDVTGKNSHWFYIYEVETDDSIDDPYTDGQWKAFAKYAKDNIEVFFIIIPKGSRKKAENRLHKLGIKAQIIEIDVNEETEL